MRPRYETEADLTREAQVMGRIATRSDSIIAFHKISNISYGMDFWVRSNDGNYVMEIKCRRNKYPFFLIAMKKIMTARLWEDTGVPAYLCVHWAEDKSIYIARPFGEDATPYSTEWHGRTKQGRGDESDMEPHARFLIKDMRKI